MLDPLVATSLTRSASLECAKHNVRYALTGHDISTANRTFRGRRQQGSLWNANFNRNETSCIEWDIFANHWSQAVDIYISSESAYGEKARYISHTSKWQQHELHIWGRWDYRAIRGLFLQNQKWPNLSQRQWWFWARLGSRRQGNQYPQINWDKQ